MFRAMLPTVAAIALLAAPCAAQDWAERMFETRSHDFGTIARGAKAEFRFKLTNLYLDDVRIAGVRTTCGCTTPRIETEWLKTYEEGAVVAAINSQSFLGHQRATVTVTIDKPYFAQVQLNVKVYVQSDVVLSPPSVALGSVDQGSPAEQSIEVQYSGAGDWRIVEVRSAHPHLSGKAAETARRAGRTTYRLQVSLDKAAPAGPVREHLMLVTNDPRSPQIPVLVEGQVATAITVSPATLFLGVVQPGQTVTRQVVVRGKEPFRIKEISSECGCLQGRALSSAEAKALFVVPVTFTAGETPGRVATKVRFLTDRDGAAAELAACGVVVGDEP